MYELRVVADCGELGGEKKVNGDIQRSMTAVRLLSRK